MRSCGSDSMITPVENGSTCSGATFQLARQRNARRAGAHQAIFAGTGVGVAGVDDHRADAVLAGQVLAADLHRRSTKAVLREHAVPPTGAFVDQHHGQVFFVGLANTGLGDADAHAGALGANRQGWGKAGSRAWQDFQKLQ